MAVKSVYNFVPAPNAEEAFYPDWADKVSHDIPFSDGESGEIEITIKAETPIFIRNGHAKDIEDNSFSHVLINGERKYFIPATSLKGMLRNVLEIISFSPLKQINDDHHAIRQIIKTEGTIIDEGYKLNDDKRNIKAGYLVVKNGESRIYPVQSYYKIRYTDFPDNIKIALQKKYGTSMPDSFDERSAAYKYENIFNEFDLERKFIPKELIDKEKSWISKFQHLNYVEISDLENDDAFDGVIVLSGQATDYSQKTSRRGEYVFKGKKSEVINNEKNSIKVHKEQFDTFLFINRNNEGKNIELKDWSYWKDKKNEGIPIFYRSEGDGQSTKIVDFGLTMMYKQPVEYSVKSTYWGEKDPLNIKSLSDIMFGHTDNPSNALKGRVFISHAFSIKAFEGSVINYVLSSPRSSFIPNYLKQEGNDGKTKNFKTYNNEPALGGYKKYPVHAQVSSSFGSGSESMNSSAIPLQKETVFKGKIRYYNLKPTEIGALFSALTIFNQENVFHSLGGLKPYGFGRVSISLGGVKANKYQELFECEMLARYGEKWKYSFTELIAMASIAGNENHLVYPELKEFQSYKNNGDFLEKYSVVANYTNDFQTTSLQEDIDSKIIEIENFSNIRIDRISHIKNLLKQGCNDKETIVLLYELANYKKIDIEAEYNKVKIQNKKIEDQTKTENEIINILSSDDVLLLESAKVNKNYRLYLGKIELRLSEIRQVKNREKANNAADEPFNFNDFSYSNIESKIKAKFKYNNFVPSTFQVNEIYEAIRKSWVIEKGVRKTKFQLSNSKKYPWSDIKKWLGEDKAKQLFEELNNKS